MLSLRAKYLIVLAMLSATTAIAAESVADLRVTLREEIVAFVRGYDRDSYVIVDVTPITRPPTKLPGTNVTLDETILTDDSGKLRLSAVTVTVLTHLDSLPKPAEDVIKRIPSLYTSNVSLKYRPALAGYQPSLVTATNGLDASSSKDAAKTTEKIKPSLTELTTAVESFGEKIAIAGLMIAGAVFLVLVALIDMTRQSRKQVTALASGAQSLGAALENSSMGNKPTLTATPSGGGQTGRALGPATSSTAIFTEFSDAGLAALFSDAYWCGKDSYAAYVWRVLPFGRKQILLSGLPFALEYVSYLSTVSEEAASWEQHPYYLNPLPIWNLDNDSIANLIKSSPSLLTSLPPMRLEATPLPASEILTLKHSASALVQAPTPDLTQVPSSVFRALVTSVKMTARNNEDDLNLLSVKDVQLDEMERIVSLAWAMHLDEDRLRNVLKTMSAADIASAWIGPDQILQRLEHCLPERKAKMIKNYSEKVRPSRTGAGYELAHRLIVDELGKQMKSTGTEETEDTEEKPADADSAA